MERWPAAVGDAIARNAWPNRLGRDGTLYVNTADAIWAFELTQRAADISRRLEVPAIRFVAGPLAGSSEEVPEPTVPLPTPQQVEAAAEIASEIGSDDLRETVAKVVGLGLARADSDRTV